MADIVNLKRMRKAKARSENEKAAAANRARFGTPKALRDAARANVDKQLSDHETHKIDRRDEE